MARLLLRVGLRGMLAQWKDQTKWVFFCFSFVSESGHDRFSVGVGRKFGAGKMSNKVGVLLFYRSYFKWMYFYLSIGEKIR